MHALTSLPPALPCRLSWLFLWMMLLGVPYIITINTSVFTDSEHQNDHAYGYKVYDEFKIYRCARLEGSGAAIRRTAT